MRVLQAAACAPVACAFWASPAYATCTVVAGGQIQCTGTYVGSGISESNASGVDLLADHLTDITTSGSQANGIQVESIGAKGANGRDGTVIHEPHDGSPGHPSGNVNVESEATITTTGAKAIGIFGLARAGDGGQGGDGGPWWSGRAGGAGGDNSGVTVTIESSGTIVTHGESAIGIVGQNHGGIGGEGGGGGWFTGGGGGGGGGHGGSVEITNDGSIVTSGSHAFGIFVHSVGGFGGDGGGSVGFVGYGGSGGSAGNGGAVTATNTSIITTTGDFANAVYAQSVGGGGGRGGNGIGVVGLGGVGGFGGNGGSVHVTNKADSGDPADATITTSGIDAIGIFAQSVGGSGGDGGDSAGLAAIGGSGDHGGTGGDVFVENAGTVDTTGRGAIAIHAQSIGGGGGHGGSSAGFSSLGGSGDNGGDAGTVNVSNATRAVISTKGDDAAGIFAQSVGGGGGDGGASLGVAPGISLAIGGSGAVGGHGGTVTVLDCSTLSGGTTCESAANGTITTTGDRSHGIHAQGIGGGGGRGGFAVALSGGPVALSAAFGGHGAGGGDGSIVNVSSNSNITTSGQHSYGIAAESIGGGGGSGGFAVAGAASDGPSISVSMGGSGGGGGDGKTVTIDALGRVTTTGEVSHGLFAQSVGGGGGNGGFAVSGAVSTSVAAAVALGGTGAGGGAGGDVHVTASGDVTTHGALSNAIHAQSIGGGGGHGGFAVGAAITSDAPALSVGIGGKGSGGGSADLVEVTSDGDLLTTGYGSHAVFAQSVGGGGGSGGFSGAFSATFGDGADVGVSIGGSGSKAGHGSSVTVTTNGTVVTTGEDAAAVVAQSIGGGGGHGGFGLSASMTSGSAPNANVAIGGSGGGGGDGGDVTVNANNSIQTSGANAHGIHAQSVGGGGGTGGFSLAGTIATTSGSKSLSVSIGGSGGTASHGGAVTVKGGGAITTTGDDAVGAFVQSIGGGGGSGGMALSGAMSGNQSRNADLSIGGNGGAGGQGGAVVVELSGPVTTSGDRAYGIHAQSIGGGGGSGGLAMVVDLTNGGQNTQVNVAVGGKGGVGGAGGTVDVKALGGVTTSGFEATAVYAQSIGGGGGNAGSASTAGIVTSSLGPGKALQIGVDIGGDAGTGATADAVTVTTDGTIQTSGDAAHAIHAQSIGGGGGRGGAANSFSLFAPGGSGGSASDNKSLNVSIGGKGGSGNHGGTVTVHNMANITTTGADAYGIFAQSIGGGGGEGGHAGHAAPISVAGENTLPPGVDKVKAYKNVRISVGGSGGASGDGEAVAVTSGDSASNERRNIVTHGDGSFGVLAQSIGGGGGIGGAGVISTLGTFGIGGAGGAAGDGRAVTVDIFGDVTTDGASAHAIMAQSIGGGGGIAGAIDRGTIHAGIGVAFQQSGGSGGSGGNVTVNSDGMITTTKDASYAIFAQSVGGGGGVLGNVGVGLTFVGSVGGSGSAGNVSVTHNGNIETSGDSSTAVFAQSASAQQSGDVSVKLTGDLTTNGHDAVGISAQSAVSTGNGGKVSVDYSGNLTTKGDRSHGIAASGAPVASGDSVDVKVAGNISAGGIDADAVRLEAPAGAALSLELGTGDYAGGSGNAAAVRFEGGGANTLKNAGTMSAASGNTIVTTTGDDTVDNSGTIFGNIGLGTGSNAINNRLGGQLVSNSQIDLGGGRLTNAGTISPGGSNNVATTDITGDFVQESTGQYLFDADFSGLPSDLINVTGSAELDGTLVVNLKQLEDGASVTILTAQGGATLAGITVADTLVLDYGIVTDGNNVNLTVNYNFDQPDLSPNEQNVALYLNRALAAGIPDALNPFFVALGKMTDPAEFKAAIASLDPEEHLSDLTTFFQSAGHFSNKLLSCPVYAGPYAAIAEGQRSWFRFTQRRVEQDETATTVGYDQNASELAVGLQSIIAPNWRLGAGLGFTRTTSSNGIDYASSGETFSGGVALKYVDGPLLLAAAVSGGYGQYDGTRYVAFPGMPYIAQSDSHTAYVNARLRGAYLFEAGRFYAKPLVDLDVTYLDNSGYRETGAGPLSMVSPGLDETLFTIRPAIQIGANITTGASTYVRSFFEAGVAFHPDNELRLNFYLADASSSVAPFEVMSSVGDEVLGLAAGLEIVSEDDLNFSLRYDTELSDDRVSHSGSFKLSVGF